MRVLSYSRAMLDSILQGHMKLYRNSPPWQSSPRTGRSVCGYSGTMEGWGIFGHIRTMTSRSHTCNVGRYHHAPTCSDFSQNNCEIKHARTSLLAGEKFANFPPFPVARHRGVIFLRRVKLRPGGFDRWLLLPRVNHDGLQKDVWFD